MTCCICGNENGSEKLVREGKGDDSGFEVIAHACNDHLPTTPTVKQALCVECRDRTGVVGTTTRKDIEAINSPNPVGRGEAMDRYIWCEDCFQDKTGIKL